MANANWYDYLDLDRFWETTPIEKPEDCDCDQPGTLTDSLIGSLESFFGKEAKDDEIIGAESLPRTPQGWGVRWRPEWFPDGRGRNLVDAYLRDADLRDTDLLRADLTGAINLDSARNVNGAFWFRTTCPDGSMNIGSSPCFGDQLIPA